MRRMKNTILCAGHHVRFMALATLPVWAQQTPHRRSRRCCTASVSTQRMNQQVPGDLHSAMKRERPCRLGDYFGKKPIVLSLVYFNCPFMCTEVLNGELRAMQGISLTLGKDYEAVTVSFDPKDGPRKRHLKNRIYTGLYGARPRRQLALPYRRPGFDSGVDRCGGFFLHATTKPSGQFAHATAIMILTPEGRVSRYFYGVQYPPRDVRLGLVEASDGKIGSPTDAALLFCYHYDPLTGKYGLVVANVIRIAGA
jgi:protein SCO1/2